MAVMQTTESVYLSDVLLVEAAIGWTKSNGPVAGGPYSLGTVLGRKTVGTVPTTGTAAGGNTGNGTCTGVAAHPGILPGTYTARCVMAATGGGLFAITSPSGACIGVHPVGAAAFQSDEISLTLNDGLTDYAVEDSFTIVVPDGSQALTGLNLSAIDGSARAVGILGVNVATATAASAMYIGRGATVALERLLWPDGITDAQKARALSELERRGITAKATL